MNFFKKHKGKSLLPHYNYGFFFIQFGITVPNCRLEHVIGELIKKDLLINFYGGNDLRILT